MNFIIENIVQTPHQLTFVSSEGQTITIDLIGDCCSASFFDDDSLLDVKGLLGERLMSIEEVSNDREYPDDPDGTYDDVTLHYAMIVKTDKQSISVMWRNESNGYYSGWVEVSVEGQKLHHYGMGLLDVSAL